MVEAIGCLDNCEVVGSQPMLIYRHFLLQQTISVALRTPAGCLILAAATATMKQQRER